MWELLEDKFSQFNQRIDITEQKLNGIPKDWKISIGEAGKKVQEVISTIQKSEQVIDELKFRLGQKEKILKEQKHKTSNLETGIEDQINRSMRTTLIFRDLNKSDTESWK